MLNQGTSVWMENLTPFSHWACPN